MTGKILSHHHRASRWDSICVPWASDLFGKPSNFSKIQSQLKWNSILVDERYYSEIGKDYAVRINTFHQIYWATVFSSSLPKVEFLYLRRIPLLAFWKKPSVHYHPIFEGQLQREAWMFLIPFCLRPDRSRGSSSNAGKMDQTWSRHSLTGLIQTHYYSLP